MSEKRVKYTQEDYARAILRSAICTVNNKLNFILNSYLPGSALISDGQGSYLMTDNFQSYAKSHNAFNVTIGNINNEFFYSPNNADSESVLAQAYGLFGHSDNIFNLLQQETHTTDVRVPICPELKTILLNYEEKQKAISKKYMKDVYEGRITLKKAKEEIKKLRTRLKGEDYDKFFRQAGYDGKQLEEMKKLVDISNYSNTNSRVVDFLDIYTMYHYYIFRKAINNRFFKYMEENPRGNYYKRQYEFEKIVREEIARHCASVPKEGNAYFDRKFVGLSTKKMDIEKAKRLTLEMHAQSGQIMKMLTDKIEHEINQSMRDNCRVQLKEVVIKPERPENAIIKRHGAKRPTIKSTKVSTNVRTVLKRPPAEKPYVYNPPMGRVRVVEKSKNPPFVSDRILRERAEKQRKEEEKARREERNKRFTQLDLFDKMNMDK